MHGASSTDGGWRQPAKELDQVVIQTIRDFLTDERRIVDAMDLTSDSPGRLREDLRRAAALADDQV